MPKIKHLHKYRKINLSATKDKTYFVYKCIKAGCSHYIPLHLAEGALCECNRCEQPMLIGREQLKGSQVRAMAYPHCVDCIKRKKVDDDTFTTLKDFLKD